MAWYRTGTVAVTNGNKNVVGTGTAWVNNVQPGDALIGPDGAYYEVDLVNSNTSISLVENYAGSTVSGAGYKVIPTQGRVRDLAAQVLQLIADYAQVQSAFNISGGHVGIGGTPTALLDVMAGAPVMMLRASAGNSAELNICGDGQATGAALTLAHDALRNAYFWNRSNASVLLGTNNTERVRIDGSGNVSVGVTSNSAWGADYRTIENLLYGSYYSNNAGLAGLSFNAYNNGINWIYKNTTFANRFESTLDSFRWLVAGDGTSGATVSFSEAMRIDSSGNLLPILQTAAPSLGTNRQMVFSLTSNTNLRVSVRGSDGVTRTANWTLA